MRNLLLIIICLAAAACSGRYELRDVAEEGNGRLAGMLRITSDSAEYYMTDYFPALGAVDSVTAPEGVRATPSADAGWDRFVLSVPGMSDGLGTLQVWRGGKKLALPAARVKPYSPGDAAPLMYTLGFGDKTIKIGFSRKPDKIAAYWQNAELPAEFIDLTPGSATVRIPANALNTERSFIRIYALSDGKMFSDVLIPLDRGRVVSSASALKRDDPRTQMIYSLMVDRFYNGNPANDRRLDRPDVLPQVDYMGGDIKGITEKIREGFFTDLGITTIWISPITQNPNDAWGLNKEPFTRFSGYHGYWPVYLTKIDDRFGTDGELEEMLAEAHKRGMNVLLDYVANHVHITSPIMRDHPDWTTPLILPDGRKNLELWDEHRLTTWFDTHIPTLDLEREEIYQPMTDSALFWLERFDFDGFRHDATKHIPEVYWRTLTGKTVERFPSRSVYQIGETYGSPRLISSYVKSGMLDGQFDFNVYDRMIWTLGGRDGKMTSVAQVLDESFSYYGHHNLMGYITGNHDRPRFISLAGGALSWEENSKAAGWNREITVGDPTGYDKLALLHAFNFTIPGVPCIYQGDEFGVPGANDPDNRRMMQFGCYNPQEQKLLSTVRELTAMRRGSMPLLYGDFIPLYADDDVLVYARVYMGDVVLAGLNKGTAAKKVTAAIPQGIRISGLEPRFGTEKPEISGQELAFNLQPLSFEILTNK